MKIKKACKYKLTLSNAPELSHQLAGLGAE